MRGEFSHGFDFKLSGVNVNDFPLRKYLGHQPACFAVFGKKVVNVVIRLDFNRENDKSVLFKQRLDFIQDGRFTNCLVSVPAVADFFVTF